MGNEFSSYHVKLIVNLLCLMNRKFVNANQTKDISEELCEGNNFA